MMAARGAHVHGEGGTDEGGSTVALVDKLAFICYGQLPVAHVAVVHEAVLMGTTRTHFRPTTPQQRRLLFETWQTTGNVTLACRTAHVGRRTFYYWKPRLEAAGYAGLDHIVSSAPKQPHRVAETVAQQVIALRQTHPTWGKQRIAHEVAKAHAWQARVSANTVKWILRDAGLWATTSTVKKKDL